MPSLAQIFNERRELFPTSLSSADIQRLDAQLTRQSVLSARMTSADALQAIKDQIKKILVGFNGASADNAAEARLKLKQIGQALNYDPAKGFPGEAAVPPAEAGSLTDLFSTDRLNLILKTQQDLMQGAAKNIWGNEPDALEQYPAWELVRVAAVEVPRGEKKVKGGFETVPEDAWDSDNGRWINACREADDNEAQNIFESTGRMIARKDSEVWSALGDGAGGYEDTLGNDFEPFAFNSGMGRVEISAKEFEDLGGDSSPAEPSDTELGSGEVTLNKSRFDPDILQTLKAGLASGDLRFHVKVKVAA